MANRVLLSSAGLKVSKAGANVLTASEADLLFNSEWAQLKLFMRGTHNVLDGSSSILFGKTFINRPLVFFRMPSGHQLVDIWTSWELQLSNNYYPTPRILVRDDRITFDAIYDVGTINYVVWDFDL